MTEGRLSPGERAIEEAILSINLEGVVQSLRLYKASLTPEEFQHYCQNEIMMDEGTISDFLTFDGAIASITPRMWKFLTSPLAPR